MTKRYRITDGWNYLYLDGKGFPRWRDPEYSDSYPTKEDAQHIINCCGYQHDTDIKIVKIAAR